jgi:amino acid permease
MSHILSLFLNEMLNGSKSMASSGLLPGVITCLLSGGVGAFGLYLLSVSATRATHRQASFFAISQLTFPKAAIFFDAAIAIKCFGVSIRYELDRLKHLSALICV